MIFLSDLHLRQAPHYINTKGILIIFFSCLLTSVPSSIVNKEATLKPRRSSCFSRQFHFSFYLLESWRMGFRATHVYMEWNYAYPKWSPSYKLQINNVSLWLQTYRWRKNDSFPHWFSMLLLLSHFSRVWFCATPYTAAHQAPPSLGFSRQEHWSGLPFPSPVHESEKWKWSRAVMSDPQWPLGLQPSRLLHPWDFPGKSTGVGCHWFSILKCN